MVCPMFFNCSWFSVLVEVDCQMFSESLELPTNVMSIYRKSVFGEHVYVVETQIVWLVLAF